MRRLSCWEQFGNRLAACLIGTRSFGDSRPMTDTANDQRRGSTAAAWLVLASMLLPVLYVLSIGPAIRLLSHSQYVGYAAAFYAPLDWLSMACKPFDDALRWYVSLWQ